MKRKIIALVLLLPFLFLSGCDRPEARNEDFTLTLHAEYEHGGQLECNATVQYTGDAERVTVYTGEPAVVFYLRNNTGYEAGGTRLDVLAKREFTKGETREFLYANGGFDEDSPPAVKAYMTDDALTLPKGTYTMTATFRYTFDPQPGVDNHQTLVATKTIKVE